jgi:hypothetical protein
MPSLKTVPGPQPGLPSSSQPQGRARLRRPASLLLVALLIIGVLLVLARALSSEQRALEKMDPQTRAALFQETWQGFQTLCQPQPAAGLASRCQEQAQFLLKFPECNAACRGQLTTVMHPTR